MTHKFNYKSGTEEDVKEKNLKEGERMKTEEEKQSDEDGCLQVQHSENDQEKGYQAEKKEKSVSH